jgi:hypothetical protein
MWLGWKKPPSLAASFLLKKSAAGIVCYWAKADMGLDHGCVPFLTRRPVAKC